MKVIEHNMGAYWCIRLVVLLALMGWGGLSSVAQDRSDSIPQVDVYGRYAARDYRSTAPRYSLTQQSFDRLGITDIANALHRLPGITLRDYGGAGGMKTVSVRGFGAQHTGVIYDGVALSDCQSGQIDVSRYSLDNVEVLALVVGDNDDIFVPAKSAASPAALLIKPHAPGQDGTGVKVQMRVGAWGYLNPYVRLDHRLSQHLALNIMGEYIHTRNDYPFTVRNVSTDVHERRTNNMMNSWHTEANMEWKPRAGHYVTAKAYLYDNDRQLPGTVHYYTNDNSETLREQNAFAQIGYKILPEGRWAFGSIAKLNYALSDYKDPSYAGNIMDHRYRQHEVYASAYAMCRLHSHWTMNYAADYTFNNLRGSDVSDYSNPIRHTVLQTLTAKYSTERWTVMARALASLYFNDAITGRKAKDMKHLSPSLSLSYRPLLSEQLYLRLSYKDIFRAPSFNESYYFHYGSTDLNPEKTDQINLGMTWTRNLVQGTMLSLSLDAYYNNVKDKIVAVPKNMFIWTNINMGRVRSLGLDFTGSISQRITERQVLTLTGNYTLQSITNRTNAESPYYKLQIAYTPVHSGSATVSWENPWVNMSLNGVFASERWANNEHLDKTNLRGYAECGLTAYRDFSIARHKLSLHASLRNLFNQQYEIVRFYPMPGRQWTITVKYSL